MTGRASVVAALVAVQVFFGLHYLAAKIVVASIPPAGWALLRAGAAAVVLGAVAAALGRRPPRDPRVVGRLALYALLGIVINQLCFVEGLARTTPTHAAIINTTIPVWTLAFAVLAGRERAGWRRLVSLGVATAGVWLVVRPDPAALAAGASWRGDLLVLINALSYSTFLVVSKPVLARVDALAATAVLLAWGTLGLAVPGLPALSGFDFSAVPAGIWTLGVLIVLFPTAGSYLLTYWALARIDSSAVALFIYLQPVIAGGLSVALLGEPVTAPLLGGAGLVFSAVWLAVRDRARQRG